jgi:hypothetical protein
MAALPFIFLKAATPSHTPPPSAPSATPPMRRSPTTAARSRRQGYTSTSGAPLPAGHPPVRRPAGGPDPSKRLWVAGNIMTNDLEYDFVKCFAVNTTTGEIIGARREMALMGHKGAEGGAGASAAARAFLRFHQPAA